jgi:hypothetical protein
MFDTFTADAQAAVIRSQEVARAQGHSHIALSHLRASLTGDVGVAAPDLHDSLARLGMADVDTALTELPAPIPFDESVKACLIRAVELASGAPVTTDHLEAALSQQA